MASRMKEDERNEKIIRGLLKLPANRRCINCNNLGPQYVCTSFGTFICTNCSGLHREFCHRVKSISMAKFTTQEVNALQKGGNEKAREVYFKEWDQQRNSLPDSSNIDRLRDFIKHVYVDRRFTGEKNTGRPLEGKADMNYSSDSGKGDSYRGGSRSPPYDDHYNERVGTGGNSGDRNFRYAYGERSPGYDQSDNKRSPRQFEVVDDRARDDRYGNGNQFRRFEERRLPDALPKPEGSSPSRQKDISSPPIVRPVRDILGDDAPKLYVGGPPKTNITMVTDSSPQIQSASSSSSLGSSDGNSTQSKKVDLGSLIDFNADPEPPVTSSPQKPVPQQTTTTPSNGGEWASFDTTSQQKAPPAASSTVTLESALSQLAAPGPILSTNGGGQWPTTQQRQTNLFPANLSTPANPPFNAPVVGSQPWGSSAISSVQGPLPNSAGHLPQGLNKPPHEPSPVVSSPLPTEVKPIGRQELPADLFAALYPSAPVYPGWQRGPHPGYGFGMQYPMGMVHPQTIPTYPSYGQVTQPSKSANPFDVGGEATLSQAPKFPSMGSLQGALPNVSGPSPILRSSSLGNLTPQWGPTQQASYPPAMAQGQYLGQQMPSNMHQLPHSNAVMMGHQGTGSPRSVGSGYGNLGMDPSSTARYPRPGTPNSFSMLGGNPFG